MHGHSFPPSVRHGERMTSFDLIILGGGIVGAGAALAAVSKGASVAVVDAGLPGRASEAGAGIISPVAMDRGEQRSDWTSVITRCVGHYRELLAEVDALDPSGAGSGTFRQVGELVVARDDPDDLAALAAIRERLSTPAGQRAHGVSEPAASLSAAEVHRYWPELRGDLQALFISEVGRVAGGRLAARLLAAARRLAHDHPGGSLVTMSGSGILGRTATTPVVRVGDERFSAGAVLLATGAWAGPDLDAFGLQVRIRPVRGQIVHLRLGDEPTGGRPVVNTPGGGYLLGFDDRVVVGATHEDVGFDVRVTASGQRQVLDTALELAPGLGAASLLETRVGLRPVSSDGLPVVGAVAPGTHIVTGLGAWGLTLGPLLGRLAAAHALGDPLPDWLDFLSPWRTPTASDDNPSAHSSANPAVLTSRRSDESD